MHFSKTYAQLLVTLPPELRNHPFEYRKLKQLINRTASELDSLGLGPSVLRSLNVPADDDAVQKCTVVYELVPDSTVVVPRLRLSLRYPPDEVPSTTTQPIYHVDLFIPEQSLHRITQALEGESCQLSTSDHVSDLFIPLPSDTAFFQLLTSTLSSLSGHSDTLQGSFNSTLSTLARSISMTALPASSSAPHSFSVYSVTAHNSATLRPSAGGKSDLSTWREIFSLYADAQVFESFQESTRGERTVEQVEKRLELFQERAQEKKASLVLRGSAEAFDMFMSLIAFILDVKKFQLANSEATRKILKKHAKRTTFPIPPYLLEHDTSPSHQVTLIARPSTSLPRLLVQAIGEVLLPVVPHIDDYACLICTSIAFKPVRLCCGHFFCVRCLVKLQKRGKPSCPMCRAPTVLQANPSNIDYGLLNFMADWFSIECREKQRANEREVTREQMEELGMTDIHICRLM